jgi:hypothetical protein
LFHNHHQWLTLDEDAVDLVEEEEIVDVDVVEQDEEQSVTTRRNGEDTLVLRWLLETHILCFLGYPSPNSDV